jgi:GntR family transcriptional regulator, transcriptional repressor for pyruvate dehydrogenase complex
LEPAVVIEPLDRPDSLTDRAVRRLTSMILDREVAAEDFLPSEKDLGARLGVSRTVVREATRILAAKGLVRAEPGRGVVVNPPERWTAIDPELLAEGGQTTLLEIFEARRVIEVEVAGLAAERASLGDLLHLQMLAIELESARGEPEEMMRVDVQFHVDLARAAGNPILARFLDSLSQLLWAGRRATIVVPGAQERSIESHNRVTEALLKREPALARHAMEEHMRQVEGEIRAATRQRTPETNDDRRSTHERVS